MIRMYENKLTESPSVCVGGVTVDFGKSETPAQARLVEAITNHPEAVLQNELCVPLEGDIIEAFLEVISETVRANSQTRITQKVHHKVAKS